MMRKVELFDGVSKQNSVILKLFCYNPDMYSISQNILHRYFFSEIKQISSLLTQNKSVLVRNYIEDFKPSLLLNYISNNYEIRKLLFRKHSDDFIFVSINNDDIVSLVNSDEEFLLYLSTVFLKTLNSFEELNNILEERENILVLYTDNVELETQRKLFSYKYFLGDKLLLVFNSDPLSFNLESFSSIEISGDIIQLIIEERARELEIEIDSSKVRSFLNSDLNKLDEAIIKSLYVKQPQEIPVVPIEEELQKFETVTQPEEIVEEVIKENEAQEELLQEITEDKKPTHSDLPTDLTSREILIVTKLRQKGFLSRTELAKIVWRKEWREKGNDNAIDKVISRIRSKFVKAGYNKSYISSKKKEGRVLIEFES